MDPVSLAVTVTTTAKLPALPDLGSEAAPSAQPSGTPAPKAPATAARVADEDSRTGLYLVLGGVGVLAAAGAGVLVLVRRSRSTTDTPS